MKTLSLILFLAGVVMAQTDLKTVPYVDLNRYKGTWYEAAKIPNFFQRNCVSAATAQYELQQDGNIKVTNTCTEDDGSKNQVIGEARIEDKKTNAKLKVSFFSILGWRPVWGDYWVIGLPDDYSYAVVGTPSRKYGWILSRQFPMPEQKLKEAFDILKRNGYDITQFKVNTK